MLLASGRVKHVGRGRYRLIDGVENRAKKIGEAGRLIWWELF